MGQSVVFISIFDLTELFFEIARGMEDEGHRVSWMATSPNWMSWLQQRGVQERDILPLFYPREEPLTKAERETIRAEMTACERQSDLTFNQCLIMDRFVRHLEPDRANDFASRYYRDTKRFLKERAADVVFAEATNLNELVAYMVCREMGILFLAPGDMRYPPDRMIFTVGYQEERLFGGHGSDPEGGGDALLSSFRALQSRPACFDRFNRDRIVTPLKLWRKVYNRVTRGEVTRPDNLTHHPVWERAGVLLRRVVNSFYLRRIARYDDLDAIPGRIAFFGLHVQPEASVDVRGSYFSDQLKLITDIRRALPMDVTLIIKEHPNFLGMRGRSYLRKLRRIPNVRIVSHEVSTFNIYKRASVVFTITGTVAYEAGMLGVPAIVFSTVFFAGLSTVHRCYEITGLRKLVTQVLDSSAQDYAADCREMENLFRNSFQGLWGDPFNMPDTIKRENLDSLRYAFRRVLAEVAQGRSSERAAAGGGEL